MIKRISCWRAACLVCVCLASALAQAQEAAPPEEAPSVICESVKALQAKDPLERVIAAQKILDGNGELVNCLVRQLRLEIVKPDLKFGSSFAQLLWVLGELRVTAVVGDLVGIIDIRLVGSPRAGGFGGPSAYYPAATALAEIGGPNLAQSILQRLTLPASEELLRVSTWVLVQAYSETVVSAIVRSELESVEATLKNFDPAMPMPEKENLERIKELLESDEPLLPDLELAALKAKQESKGK